MTSNTNTEIRTFVAVLLLNESDPRMWTAEDAEYNMRCWAEEGIEMPESMDPGRLAAEWNRQII